MTNPYKNEIVEHKIQYIVSNGYYSNIDDGNTLYPHTKTTHEMYNEGLNLLPIIRDCDIFNGIEITNDKPRAEWDIDGDINYYDLY